MTQQHHEEQEFSFKSLFVPLTTLKAIHWIVIIGLIVYFRMLFNGFAWDDETFIFYNAQIKHFNLINLIGPNLFNSAPYYRPIPAIYFSLLYAIFNNLTFFYHLLQLILHITNTSLLFLLLRKFFKNPLALFLSLIFLIHPINVESVAYIAATQSELFFLFGMLALLLGVEDSVSLKKIISINVLLLLALLTKEVSLLFFFVIYFYRFLYKKYIPQSLVFYSVAVIILYLIIRSSAIGIHFGGYQNSPIATLSLGERLINIPSILLYYIKSFLFPTTFAIDQIWTITTIRWGTFFFPLIIDVLFYGILLIFGYYCVRLKKDRVRPYIYFLCFYILGISMLIQVFPLDMTVADRWFYFPMVGLLGIIGVLLQNFSFKRYKFFISIFFLLVLLTLSYKTIMREGDWKDAFTLYRHDLSVYDNPIIEEAYGIDLGETGQYPSAISHFKKSVALSPRESSLANLANTYQNMGELSQAVVYYEKAMQIGVKINGATKHYEDTYINYTKLLIRLHELNKAGEIVSEGITQFPNSLALLSLKSQIDQSTDNTNILKKD